MNDQQQITDRLLDLTVNRYFGKYRGIVEDNEDPFYRGRLSVKVPAVLDDVTLWAMPCMPFAGKDMGLFMIPDNGTAVWVEFEGGDLSYPIWTGCFWTDDESPKDQASKTPAVKLIRSSKGLTISLDDDSEKITVTDKSGNNVIVIDTQSGRLQIKSNATVSLEAGSILLGGDAAVSAVIKGTEFMAYLTTAMTAIAAVFPAVTPPPPGLLSMKVKTI